MALQGMAPGLSVNFGSGAAGSSATLQVRGVTSWKDDDGENSESNGPLVIIDGVPGNMSYLNPEDIKSISVLKDAATAAIYGSRSAAGVILIETHRGTMNSAPKITFSGYWGLSAMPKRLEVCNSAEFIKVRKMALTNAGTDESRWPKYISEYERDRLSLLILIGRKSIINVVLHKNITLVIRQVVLIPMCLFLLSIVRRTV